MAKENENKVSNEDQTPYKENPGVIKFYDLKTNAGCIARAIELLENQDANVFGDSLSSPTETTDYCFLKLNQDARKEKFMVIYLNAKNKIISSKIMGNGTIDQCAVYPREVVREALLIDACAVILSHNHPSGDSAPSQHDRRLTTDLAKALKIFGIHLHDHIIVGNTAKGYYSFAEEGSL